MATFIETRRLTDELRQGAFVIRKIHSAYLVSVLEFYVFVKPFRNASHTASTIVTASTLQMVGNSKLLLHRPQNPCQYLIEYYKNLGWNVEIAD